MLLLGLIFWIIEVEKERRHESPHRTRKHSKVQKNLKLKLINELLVKNAICVVLFKYNTRYVADCKLQKVSTSQHIVDHIRKSWSD